jgi:hypothetical protein
MSRIEFGGQGFPIPPLALPPFGSDSDIAPTVLTFTANTDFPVVDYISLGFTHFEVWCVGGAGGRGGDATSNHIFAIEEVRRPVPQDIWNLYLEYIRITDYFTSGEWDHLYFYGPSAELPNNGLITIVQHTEFYNPTHLMDFKTYKQVVLNPSYEGLGGGGGGGGFQKAIGLLADLPDVVPIVVGQAGTDAGYGQIKQNGSWAPDMPGIPYPNWESDADPTLKRLHELSNFFHTYLNTYPLPHPSFSNPQPGGNGGASSFAGEICQASGGEGGDPGMVWDGTKFVVDGDGGDGGIGGRSDLGGGALGSVATGVNGADGGWLPETGIGAGGGGGKGGRVIRVSSFPIGTFTYTIHLATASGQGSYSFADTTVYGQRQFRQPLTYMKPVTVPKSGVFTFVLTVESNYLVTPGGGGGARPLPNTKVGGRGVGYSPNGIVVLRLVKIT